MLVQCSNKNLHFAITITCQPRVKPILVFIPLKSGKGCVGKLSFCVRDVVTLESGDEVRQNYRIPEVRSHLVTLSDSQSPSRISPCDHSIPAPSRRRGATHGLPKMASSDRCRSQQRRQRPLSAPSVPPGTIHGTVAPSVVLIPFKASYIYKVCTTDAVHST